MKNHSKDTRDMMKSAEEASRISCDIVAEILASCDRDLYDFAKILQTASCCKTTNDIARLQYDALRHVWNNYSHMRNEVCGILCHSPQQKLPRLGERTDYAVLVLREVFDI